MKNLKKLSAGFLAALMGLQNISAMDGTQENFPQALSGGLTIRKNSYIQRKNLWK